MKQRENVCKTSNKHNKSYLIKFPLLYMCIHRELFKVTQKQVVKLYS